MLQAFLNVLLSRQNECALQKHFAPPQQKNNRESYHDSVNP